MLINCFCIEKVAYLLNIDYLLLLNAVPLPKPSPSTSAAVWVASIRFEICDKAVWSDKPECKRPKLKFLTLCLQPIQNCQCFIQIIV